MFVYVTASAAALSYGFKISRFLMVLRHVPLVAPPGVFDQDPISRFAFGHYPRLGPPSCGPPHHGPSWRGFIAKSFVRLLVA